MIYIASETNKSTSKNEINRRNWKYFLPDEWQFNSWWYKQAIPNFRCNEGEHKCTNAFCKWHGYDYRYAQYKNIMKFPIEDRKFLWACFSFGTSVNSNICKETINTFLALVRKLGEEITYTWRLHWRYFVPHFHSVISYVSINNQDNFRSCWIDALASVGHPCPSAPRKQIKEITWQQVSGKVWYMWQLHKKFKKGFPKEDCAPLEKGWRLSGRHPNWNGKRRTRKDKNNQVGNISGDEIINFTHSS